MLKTTKNNRFLIKQKDMMKPKSVAPMLVVTNVGEVTLHGKKNVTIKFDDFNEARCVRVGRSYGSFVTQNVHSSVAESIMHTSKIIYWEVKPGGSIHVVLSVSGETRKFWSWFHIHSTTAAVVEPTKWGKIPPSACLDEA